MIIALLNWLIHDILNTCTYLALIHYIVMVCSESLISYVKPVFICPRYITVNLPGLIFFFSSSTWSPGFLATSYNQTLTLLPCIH